MTTYRLADGTEAESIDPNTSDLLPGASLTWINHPSLGPIAITDDKLTEVNPPREPGLLAVAVDRDGMAWQREAGTGLPDWHSLTERKTWRKLNAERGPLTLLIPDPADDAPDLPWRDSGDTIEVADPAANDDTPLWVHIKACWRSTAEARRLAALLLRAAREAEQR